jgi:acetoin utilization deacetylase AcuC-like enzyme
MVTIYTDARMLEHTPHALHPERPERLQGILRHLEQTGQLKACPTGKVREATRAELTRVHSEDYLHRLAAFEVKGGGMYEPDTYIFPGSKHAARLAAGATIEAVREVLQEPHRRALCLVRPPGHHALPSAAMGFCLLNNIAVAAADARDRAELDRILVIDFDIHHGNGTQQIFYDDPRVAFLSIHRYPFYPGTGAKDETGTKAGLGFTRNIPLPYGTPRSHFLSSFRSSLDDLADKVRPDLVLVSAGFDAHVKDPVGDLGLEIEDFVAITREIVRVAETHADGRIVSVLEGGYNIPILASCVAAHLEALSAERIPET